MKLVIDRSIWLRGEGGKVSFLLRGDGKMCCLGQLAEQCKIPKSRLLDIHTPGALTFEEQEKMRINYKGDTSDISWIIAGLLDNNDSQDISEEKREENLTYLFSQLGIELSFK